MPSDLSPHVADLPLHVQRVLRDLVTEAEAGLGPDLHSVTLFGSAAEGRLRPTTDVNVILVLAAFKRARADRLREPLRWAHAAELNRLRQVTLNLALRGREQHLARSLRAEQAAAFLAELPGPLRSSAAALLELEGVHVESGRSALEQVCRSLGGVFAQLPVLLSELREGGRLTPEAAASALFDAVRLAGALHERAARLA